MAFYDPLVGSFSGGFSGIGLGFAIFFTCLIVAIIFAVITFFIANQLKYKYKIVIFENIGGQGYTIAGRDKACLIGIGDTGEQILKLKKRKLFRQAYGKKIANNTYAFAICSDGYWRNISFGNVDEELNKLGIEPVDRDMRYMNVSIRRNIQSRFEKKNWFKENIGMLVGITSIVIVLIFIWLIFREFSSITGGAKDAVDASAEVVKEAARLLAGIDNINSGGSGLAPA